MADSIVYTQALEAQIGMLRHVNRQVESGDVNRLADNHLYKGDANNFWPALAQHVEILETAVPYYWDADLCDVLEKAAPTLKNWSLKMSQYPSAAGYIHFARPLSMPMPTAAAELAYRLHNHPRPPRMDLTALGWKRTSAHTLMVVSYLQTSVRAAGEMGMTITLDSDITLDGWIEYLLSQRRNTPSEWMEPIIEEHDAVMSARLSLQARYFAAAISFLNTPLLTYRQGGQPHRALRKRLEQERVAHVPEVQVVELRKRKYVGEARQSDTVNTAHHRFMVGWADGGFWNRYHLRDGTIEEKWILPFMKRANRTDLPILQPKARINVVVR